MRMMRTYTRRYNGHLNAITAILFRLPQHRQRYSIIPVFNQQPVVPGEYELRYRQDGIMVKVVIQC
jgi:hypothetical protein